VVGANGNFGQDAQGNIIPGSVRSPAIAHKVIGIGAYDVESATGETQGYQSRGSANDGRYKPDIQTPTNTETASNASDTALRGFGGTSGATPYGSGAAALLRNWLRSFGTFDPAATYTQLIEGGRRPWCCYDNNEGAGDLQLITNATASWGKVDVIGLLFFSSTINIPIGVGPGSTGIEAALWWPERAAERHDDIDLYLIDPSGTERARGYSGVSVFERARVTGPLAPGTWTLRVKAYDVVDLFGQDVYWVADVRH